MLGRSDEPYGYSADVNDPTDLLNRHFGVPENTPIIHHLQYSDNDFFDDSF